MSRSITPSAASRRSGVDPDALVTDDEHHVARELGDGRSPVGEDRLAHSLEVLRKDEGGLELLAGVIERPGGDGADELLPPLVRVGLHVEQPLELRHHLLVRAPRTAA